MDSLTFDPFFIVFILVFAFVQLALRSTVMVTAAHFTSKWLSAYLAKWFQLDEESPENKRLFFLSYEMVWIIVAPLTGFLDYGIAHVFKLTSLPGYFTPLNFATLYLLSSTFWNYDRRMAKIIQKSFGFIVLNSLLFVILTFFLNIASYTLSSRMTLENVAVLQLYQSALFAIPFALLTCLLIRLNRRSVLA